VQPGGGGVARQWLGRLRGEAGFARLRAAITKLDFGTALRELGAVAPAGPAGRATP
jgi:hypothetical protein